jgi:hypothetical protein
MIPADILRMRLANQRLTCPTSSVAALVAHLGAVQSQDYPGATWALALRLRNASAHDIEAAFASGEILRTHVLRPTWHFVAAADIRWMLALTAPRIRASAAARWRSLGLDTTTLARASGVIRRALRGGASLTRSEIGTALREAGFEPLDGPQLGHILLHAELDAMVCSGPPRGRQQTYALLEARAPAAIELERELAVAELTWRYFSSHGPALVRDCGWWSGLTVAEINRGLAANAHRLRSEKVDNNTYWFACDMAHSPAKSAYLLPNYDEYTVAYRERDLYYDRQSNATGDPRLDVPFRHVLLVDGQVMGRWRARPRMIVQWTIAPTPAQRRAVEGAAVRRYTEFYQSTAESSAS